MKLWFQRLQKVAFGVVLSTVTICFARIFFLLINVGFFENVDEVSRPWQVDPIVSIYVPPQYVRCMHDYEAVFINQALSGNRDILPDIRSHFWRLGTICIKRGGKASVSYTKHWSGRKIFHDRPVPDHNGRCHDGFKKCGDGFNQQEGAICFPFDVKCPITNILVQSSPGNPPSQQYWENAGTFPQSNYTLFLRRQYINEFPITDVTVQLTQFDAHGRNVRGVYCTGPSQTLGNKMFAANHTSTWHYDVALPPVCDTTDQRYQLVDQVSFDDHFVQNLKSRGKPRCRSICLDTSFAVREALHEYKNVSLGLYFAREAPWSESCGVTRVALHKLHIEAKNSCAVLFMAALVWITSLVLVHQGNSDLVAFVGIVLVFAFIVWHLYFTQQVTHMIFSLYSVHIYNILTHKLPNSCFVGGELL